MRGRKRYLKFGVPVVVLLAGAIGTNTLLRWKDSDAIPVYTQPTVLSSAASQPLAAVPGLPARLQIPKLNIDTPVDSLGLTSEGDLDTPNTATNAGWYNAGARPGVIGSAVIDGHYGYANNVPAVFDHLHTLVKGDVFYVEDEQGVRYAFMVSGLRTFSPDDDTSPVFSSSDGRAHLNLITCQGTWNKDKASYSNRLVVFAEMLSE